MPECYGYAGKVLKIDLCSRTTSEYPWSDRDRAENLGGKIMAARILHDHLSGQETAFSEDNWVVISTGPLTGTGAPGSARFDIAALSPQNDLPAFSNCGGAFGIWLKKAGYDALILTGRSREQCWLEITEEQVLFHEAKELWGTGTGQCQEKLSQLLGTRQFGRLCIGPAGENLVKFASVVGDGHSAGRAGMGAVLGWKNVKAIVVSGTRPIQLWDPKASAEWNRNWHAQLRTAARIQNPDETVCTSCPLRCSKHPYTDVERLLNELGMDAIAARNAADFVAAQDVPLQTLYEDIAFRRGVGAILPDGLSCRKGNGGKRRGGNNGVIIEVFHLSPDTAETDRFCRSLMEAISAAGQCVLTVNGLRPSAGEDPLPVPKMLALATGMEMDLERFLRIGKRFAQLEQQMHQKIKNNRL